MKRIYKNNEQDILVRETEKNGNVDLRKCTEEEFWQEVKYSGNGSHSER